MTTPDKEEMPTEDRTVFVEVVGGRAGECLCINDRRVAGPKPWGGGAVVRRFEVPISELQLVMAALSTLPVNDRQTSDDAGRLRDDALANLKWEARFLLNRLSDLSFDDLDDLTRDFNGHVEPSISRLDRILSGMEARAALKGVPQPATPKEAAMTEAQIKHMVDRFLMWKLPEHFNPDDGISFDPVASKGTPYEFRRSPSGTNLFSAEQATAMVRHMLEGLPQPASDDYQADAGAPALSEKVNVRSEWRPIESAPADGTEILAYMPGLALGQIVLYWQDGYWRKKANSMGLKYPPTHWMPLPSPPGAELNFSNEPESDAGSLTSDTSSQPASEAGKLSSEAES